MLAVTAALVWVPLVASVPLQPPDAAQVVAFEVDQVSVTVPPLATSGTLEVKVTVGAGGAATTDNANVPASAVEFGVAMKFRR